jgi:hypothetical protein
MLNNHLEKLDQFTGTENWYRSPFNIPAALVEDCHFPDSKFIYTDGVKYMAEEYGAYWLIDAVLSHAREIYASAAKTGDFDPVSFIQAKLDVKESKAVLTFDDGNENEYKEHRQEIEFTDFPEGVFSLWIECGVLLLPSEH